MKRISMLVLVILFLSGTVTAHPHFKKTVSADMRGKIITLNFTTYPFNEAHLSQVDEGFVFHCGRATLTLTEDVTSGALAVPAGEYLVRAVAKSLDDWTLVLVPAEEPGDSSDLDLSKVIRLESSTLTDQPISHHLALDLNSGHGETDAMMILSVSFGDRRIEGVLGLN